METIFACFVLLAADTIDNAEPKWVFQEVPDERTMRIFATNLERNEKVIDWHCRAYGVIEKEGMA